MAIYFFLVADASVDQDYAFSLDGVLDVNHTTIPTSGGGAGITSGYPWYSNTNLTPSLESHTLVALDMSANMLFQSIIYT